jgi:hypothetical protein
MEKVVIATANPGWRAVFVVGDDSTDVMPIIAWALAEDEDGDT